MGRWAFTMEPWAFTMEPWAFRPRASAKTFPVCRRPERRRKVGACAAIAAALVLTMGGVIGVHAQPSTLERKLKAAFVAKFPQFVVWPEPVAGSAARVDVCVGLPDPFGPDIDDLVSGQTLGGRQMAVRRVETDQDLDGCRVLYLAMRAGGRPHPLLRRASALPILTVSDDPHFLDQGGIVRLRLAAGRVRFDIDAATARRVGLRISSQLLQLATTVRGGGA